MHATRTCSVVDCDRPQRTRTWCNTHYQRWRTTGVEPTTAVAPYGRACSVTGCADKHIAGGFCSKHYQRTKHHGSPSIVLVPKRSIPTYDGLHIRIRRVRGKASTLLCLHCGAAAQEWAYDRTDPAEIAGDSHGYPVVYSLDVQRYIPLCVPCHRKFDKVGEGDA